MEEWNVEFYSVSFSRRGGEVSFYAAEDATEIERDSLPDLLREDAPQLPGVKATVGREQQGGKAMRSKSATFHALTISRRESGLVWIS